MIHRDIILNVKTSLCKVPVIHVKILKKSEFSQQIFEEKINIKFNQNPSSGIQVVSRRRTDGWTDRHQEANSRFSQFLKRP
jgi:hypothetical protein